MAALIEAIAAVGEVARVAAVPAEVAALPAEAAAIPAEIAALDSVEMAAAKAAPKISTWKKVSTWMGDHYNVVVPMSLVGSGVMSGGLVAAMKYKHDEEQGNLPPPKRGEAILPALFEFDVTNLTAADMSILYGITAEPASIGGENNAVFRNEAHGFEAEGLVTQVENTLANGISKGRFAIPIGENNATTEGNFIVVDLNEAEDAAGAAFSKFHELFSSPDTMNLLKILDHLAEGLKGEDKVTR